MERKKNTEKTTTSFTVPKRKEKPLKTLVSLLTSPASVTESADSGAGLQSEMAAAWQMTSEPMSVHCNIAGRPCVVHLSTFSFLFSSSSLIIVFLHGSGAVIVFFPLTQPLFYEHIPFVDDSKTNQPHLFSYRTNSMWGSFSSHILSTEQHGSHVQASVPSFRS